jgi:hypothetical protein
MSLLIQFRRHKSPRGESWSRTAAARNPPEAAPGSICNIAQVGDPGSHNSGGGIWSLPERKPQQQRRSRKQQHQRQIEPLTIARRRARMVSSGGQL